MYLPDPFDSRSVFSLMMWVCKDNDPPIPPQKSIVANFHSKRKKVEVNLLKFSIYFYSERMQHPRPPKNESSKHFDLMLVICESFHWGWMNLEQTVVKSMCVDNSCHLKKKVMCKYMFIEWILMK